MGGECRWGGDGREEMENSVVIAILVISSLPRPVKQTCEKVRDGFSAVCSAILC